MKTNLHTRLTFTLLMLIFMSACSDNAEQTTLQETNETMTTNDTADATNPFYSASTLPLQYPAFDQITTDHYLPAFERGMAEHIEEIAAIVNQAGDPTFENTMLPLEESGELLNRVATVFFAMSSAHTNDAIDEIEVEIAPRLSTHQDQIFLDAGLFARVQDLYERRNSLGLDAESVRLVEENYKDFVRAGAQLDGEQKEQLKAINLELAELSTSFSQNVLDEVNAKAIVVDSAEELTGLTEAQIQTAADAAESRDMLGKFVIPLLNTSGQPWLSSLDNRALRQRIHETSLSRGHSGGEFDNREILSRTATLRAIKSRLLGFNNHAEYILQNQTAQTVAAVNQRLADLTPPAIANARREAADLQAMIEAEGGEFQLASWDWDYYAEKVRQERYDFDASELKPYLEANNVLFNGVFFAANQIYGITFEERPELPVYQEDVRAFEVFDADGSTLAFVIMDLYARSTKRGGAWMNAYVSQSNLLDRKPVVGNHLNIPKPPEGEPTLMTFDEVTTMFHEFGHALHGMFSDVTYPSFAGTSVPRDFVEYPSQVNEMWSDWPEVLENYAVHYETGEPMPRDLLDKVFEAQKFNQGFASSEYLMSSIGDMALHQLTADEVPSADEIVEFERQALADAGALMEEIPPRYHLTYFSHIMGGYSAGYYSYIWSEVLDADTVKWFEENGGMNRENGQYFRDTLLSKGGSVEAMELFRNFRGREPDVTPLLERRGLTPQ
ncbi:MAG: M3 family metallopeptidase [Gammaproteobacteria bacterium]|nr:M3 family metallopeptidase [Gammaproteobacteria bacterium]